MRAFLKFLINIALIVGSIWLLMRFTTIDERLAQRWQGVKQSSQTSQQNTSDTSSCTTPWGVKIPDGSRIFAYAQPMATAGVCEEEIRVCKKGVLQGKYVYASCAQEGIYTTGDSINSGGIAANGVSCQTPRGQTIMHGNYIVAYESPSSCRFQRRMCVDGKLLGKFLYNYCLLQASPVSSFASRQTDGVPMYDSLYSVENASTFSDTINGTSIPTMLSPADQPRQYGGENANTELPHDYWNETENGSVNVIRTRNTTQNTTQKSTPLATNGQPYPYTPAVDGTKAYTNYDLTQKGCTTPWGTYVDHGQYAIAYKTSTPKAGGSCEYERRTCLYGKLSGTFSKPSCGGATSSSRQYSNRGYDQYYWPKQQPVVTTTSCRTPRGTTIKNGEYIRSYKYASAPWADGCEGEIRYCHNGVLDGSYRNKSCKLVQPSYQGCYGRSCNPSQRGNSCSLPWGGSVSHGQSVTAYQKVNGSCYSQTRTCSNGWLQGSYSLAYCTNTYYNNDYYYNDSYYYHSCSLPRGGSISHGQSIDAYSSSTNPCYKEVRRCQDGTLHGSYGYASCTQGTNTTTDDEYGNWEDMGFMMSVPHGSDTCHSNANDSFTCGSYDAKTCVDYKKTRDDCCIADRASYAKRTVTCRR